MSPAAMVERRAAPAGMLGLAVALASGLGCSRGSPPAAGSVGDGRATATASPPSTSHPRATMSSPASGSAEPSSRPAPSVVVPSSVDSSTFDAQAWLNRYWAGQEVLTSSDPTVVFVAGEANATCAPLPAQRPDGFEGYHFSSDSELRYSPYHGFAAAVCHFEWTPLWLQRPAAHCTRLDPGALDYVYGELRRLEIWKLKTRPAVGANPDRPGFEVILRWPGHRCDLVDRGRTEMDPGSYPAFRAVVDLLERVRLAGEAAAPGRADAAPPKP